MSSAEAPVQPSIWLRIVKTYLVSIGALHLLAGATVLFAILRHHVEEYHEALALTSSALLDEYMECKGDLKLMKGHFKDAVETTGTGNLFLLLAERDGSPALEESSSGAISAQMLAWLKAPSSRTRRFTADAVSSRGGEIAVRAKRTAIFDGRTLVVGVNVANDERHALRVASLFSATLVLTVLLTAVVGLLLARRFTAPLRRIADAARRIEAGKYTARVPVSREGQEIAELEGAFNTMCEKNEKTLTELRMLTDNIAHDLRTPLTRLRAAAEAHMMGGTTETQLTETVLEESEGMLNMINTMLEISRTESGISNERNEDIDLVPIAASIVELYSSLAEDGGVSLSMAASSSRIIVQGQKAKFQQMIGNLVDNAVKFTPRGGSAEVRLSDSPVTIEVSNTGPGIRAEDIPHVFRRFWRADTSRSRPGNGLGLALVDAIVSAYGGKMDCRSEPGGKTVFTAVFG